MYVYTNILGTEILAALTPSILTTTDTAINRFSPTDRDCYLDSEFSFPNLRWQDGFRWAMNEPAANPTNF
jgi:hypothetical protein